MHQKFPLMLFAAGFGTRMGALTKDHPKPLIKVAGRCLIDHALDLSDDRVISVKVVNLHYLGDQIAAHLQGREIAFSWELDQILETGGGLKAALPFLGDGPVITLNTDAVWAGHNPLMTLAEAWDPAQMDVLFLLLPASSARSASGRSDFIMDSAGRVDWAKGRHGHHYLGAQIIHPRLLIETEPAFSLRGPWSRAIDSGRAFGVQYQGDWCDVGHPDGIAEAEAMLRQGAGASDV